MLFLISCGNNALPPDGRTPAQRNANQIKAAAAEIKTGDIIFRSGKDVTSYRIKELSDRDKTYSHAGIAIVKPQGILIYHLTPPDVDEPKSDTLVRLETLEKFADPQRNFEFGIGRFDLSTEQVNRLVAYADSLRNAGTSFDWQFDLNSANKMYCSEMVDGALRYATQNAIALKRNAFKNDSVIRRVARYLHTDEKIVRTGLYIPIDNIYLDSSCTIVAQYKFD